MNFLYVTRQPFSYHIPNPINANERIIKRRRSRSTKVQSPGSSDGNGEELAARNDAHSRVRIAVHAGVSRQKNWWFCHVYIGQEAVAVGTIAATEARDPIVTAYRDHGHALARGMDPKHCMAEMYGRIGGCAKGKGGSMHMFDRDNNLFGGHGIVGAQIPLGVGLAFATKYEDEVINADKNGGKSNRVTLAFWVMARSIKAAFTRR